MNVHISYKTAKAPDLEKQFNHQIEKLGRRLQVFRPELIHLKGIIEQSRTREGVVVSLNLRLPSGQMASQQAGPTAIAAVKAAFADLVSQLTRHKTCCARSSAGDCCAARYGRSPCLLFLSRKRPQQCTLC